MRKSALLLLSLIIAGCKPALNEPVQEEIINQEQTEISGVIAQVNQNKLQLVMNGGHLLQVTVEDGSQYEINDWLTITSNAPLAKNARYYTLRKDDVIENKGKQPVQLKTVENTLYFEGQIGLNYTLSSQQKAADLYAGKPYLVANGGKRINAVDDQNERVAFNGQLDGEIMAEDYPELVSAHYYLMIDVYNAMDEIITTTAAPIDVQATPYQTAHIRITEISDDYFIGTLRNNVSGFAMKTMFKVNLPSDELINEARNEDYMIGDEVVVEYDQRHLIEDNDGMVEITAMWLECRSSDNRGAAMKPVIYLYPQVPVNFKVSIDYDGQLTTTYPAYKDGWQGIANPDGTLLVDDHEYSYLFWEGFDHNEYDMSKGFVVKGEDSAEFLQNVLSQMGLLPKEYNEFIVYWLPQLADNAYNLITFQQADYTDHARLTIDPEPDSVLRIFMVYQALNEPIDVEKMAIEPFIRHGFTVVEWGGCELKTTQAN
ncbi:hypothetical protein [Dielma fastidiosa]|uniref:hypothetical protein n=1 Tax=Dielma fastidiosa TaxID=1034346 RepID=UPI0035636C37